MMITPPGMLFMFHVSCFHASCTPLCICGPSGWCGSSGVSPRPMAHEAVTRAPGVRRVKTKPGTAKPCPGGGLLSQSELTDDRHVAGSVQPGEVLQQRVAAADHLQQPAA